MNLTIDQLNKIVQDSNAFEKIEQNVFKNIITEIILRRVVAHGQAIPYHMDNARHTMQIALNSPDEYDGCRLAYFLPNLNIEEKEYHLETPQRPIGAYTIHDHTVIHCVTKMNTGTRYSLFFLTHSWDDKK